MYTPMPPKAERSRIPTPREYREWQLALRGSTPVKRFENEPGLLTRLASTIHRAAARKLRPVAEPRRIEQKASRLHG
jgi:hypothetical protein